MDTLLRLAFLQIEQENAEELQGLIDRDEADISIEEMDNMYERSKPKIARLFDLEARWTVRKRFIKHTLPRITQVAAAVLLVFFIGITTAVATVHAVRIRVLEFLINMEDQYAELSLIEKDDITLDVPNEWKGRVYLSYIPEGFKLSHVGKEGYKVFYEDGKGHTITFTEYNADFEVNMDVENSEIRHIDIKGETALMATKDGTSLITWANYDRFYLLRVDSSPEDAERIAQEMIRIR